MKRSRISAGSAVFILLIFCIPILVFTLVGTSALQADPLDGAAASQPTPPPVEEGSFRDSPDLSSTFLDPESGAWIDEWVYPSGPRVGIEEQSAAGGIEPRDARGPGDVRLTHIPAFDWCYGCSATSAAMMFGYYDNGMYYPGNSTFRGIYDNMYAGPTNGGVCPMTNAPWGWMAGECPLSATHLGFDGLLTNGSVDDYWFAYGSPIDPYWVGNWTEHGYANCTADFMGTNQKQNWNNTDGSTTFYYFTNGAMLCDYSGNESHPMGSPWRKRDGAHGMAIFVSSRGYNVTPSGMALPNGPNMSCNQYIKTLNLTYGFSLAQYKAEIDAGRPVLVHLEGHTMIGYGYSSTNNSIDIHDTWDYLNHTMTWGGYYSGMPHLAVSIVHLDQQATPTPTATPSPSPTPSPSATPTTTATATTTATPTTTATATASPSPTPTATVGWFWKLGNQSQDYAPVGIPDFDQRQAYLGMQWMNMTTFKWSHCGPVAAANSIWWFDSDKEPFPQKPPIINDNYFLLTSYNPAWDDHDPLNVRPFVSNLAQLFDTDGMASGIWHNGTRVNDLYCGIGQYLFNSGYYGYYYEKKKQAPNWNWIQEEIYRCEDVILLLGFWQWDLNYLRWNRVGGHYVTAAGFNATHIAISDPFWDNAEMGGPGRVPVPHPGPHGPNVHNNSSLLSHDIYLVTPSNSPGGNWALPNYAMGKGIMPILGQNWAANLLVNKSMYNPIWPVHTEIDYAVAVSPKPEIEDAVVSWYDVLPGVINVSAHVINQSWNGTIHDAEILFWNGTCTNYVFKGLWPKPPLQFCNPQTLSIPWPFPPPQTVVVHYSDINGSNVGFTFAGEPPPMPTPTATPTETPGL